MNVTKLKIRPLLTQDRYASVYGPDTERVPERELPLMDEIDREMIYRKEKEKTL